MFVEHSVEVDVPVGSLETMFLKRFRDAEVLGEAVYRRGEELRSRVGPDQPFAKEVVLNLGHPRISHSGLAIPITWRATGARTLFPRLTGELEITRTSVDRSRLRLRASYDPPFGWIGDVVDRLLLERVARLTVADWLERVAEDLESDFPGALESAERKVDLDDSTDSGN